MPKPRTTLLIALPLLVGTGLVAAYLLTRAPAPDATSEAAPSQAAMGCDLVDNGELDRIEPVRFTPVHPDRHSRIFGVGLTDTLSAACETLIATGFRLEDMTNTLVPISDIGNPADERAARYTHILQLRGPVTNPLDGLEAEATVILRASSPATYSSVEYMSVSLSHATPVTLETWERQVTDYLGPPSDDRPGRSPAWILNGPDMAQGTPDDLCNAAIVDPAAPWWEALPEIDEQAAITDSLPAHDGRTCTILVTAEAASAEGDPALVGRTRLAFVDYVSVAANRRAENAHARSLRYPTD